MKHKEENLEYRTLVLEYERTIQNEVSHAIELYINALKQKTYYVTAESNRILSEIQHNYVLSKKKLGTASELEVINAKAEYDNAIYQAESYKLDYVTSLSKLKTKLQIQFLTLSDIIINKTNYVHVIMIDDKSMQKDVNNYYGVKAINNSILILKNKKKGAIKARWIPSLLIKFNLDWYKMNYIYHSNEWENDMMGGRIDMALNFPLFERNISLNEIKKNTIQIRKKEIELDNIMETTITELTELIENHNNKVKLLPISKKRFNSIKLNKEMMQESYKLGATSLIDLYQAEKQFREAKRDVIFLELDIILLKAKIGEFLGHTMLYLGQNN